MSVLKSPFRLLTELYLLMFWSFVVFLVVPSCINTNLAYKNSCIHIYLIKDLKFDNMLSWSKEKDPSTEKHVGKRRRRRDRVQEAKQASRIQVCDLLRIKIEYYCLFVYYNHPFEQKILTSVKRVLLFLIILVAVMASSYYGYKGLLKLSDWMNEVEAQRQKTHPRF